jgi:hypothetical protein
MIKTTTYLKRIAHLEIALAVVLIFMPLVLYLVEKGTVFKGCEGELNQVEGFRDSISNYVYMHNAQIFGMFLGAAAIMFIYNGMIYLKKEEEIKQIQKSGERGHFATVAAEQIEKEKPHGGKFYNIIFGLSLLGVLLFPHCEFPIPHYVSAVIFFVGSIVLMAFAGNKKFRKTGIFLAVISTVSLVLSFVKLESFTLFFAEWVALTAIAIHYVLEANYNATLYND